MFSQKIKYSRIGIRLIFEHFVNLLYVVNFWLMRITVILQRNLFF